MIIKDVFLLFLAVLAIVFLTTLITRPEMLVIVTNVSWILGLVVAVASAIYGVIFLTKKSNKPKWVRIVASVLLVLAIVIAYLTGLAGIKGIIGLVVAFILAGVALFIARGK